MILFEHALELVLKETPGMKTERIGFTAALGRILAEDLSSDISMPPFDKSAVDGYACRMKDLGKNLAVVETIAAGAVPRHSIEPGTCSKIMTGAMLPQGADCVIMVEETEEFVAGTIRFTGEKTSANICYLGEDIKAGEKILSAGKRIRPQEIAVLASTGNVNPLVSVQPRVAIITTGDELVAPAVQPAGAMIRNSNSYQLEAQVTASGAIALNLGIVPDKHKSITEILSDAIKGYDIVLLTGGVSMGDFDYVPGIMKSLGIKILFSTIAIRPGKPTVFGKKGNKLIFGLPGNPVSSFVLYEMLVRPLILKMMGCTDPMPKMVLPLGEDLKRKKTDRRSFVPVSIRDGMVFGIDYHGSAHINAYTQADGIVTMDIGTDILKKGTVTDVRPV